MTHGSIAANAGRQATTPQRSRLRKVMHQKERRRKAAFFLMRDAWRQALSALGSAQFLVLMLSCRGSIGESSRRHAEAARASLHSIRVQQIAKCDEGVLNDRSLGVCER